MKSRAILSLLLIYLLSYSNANAQNEKGSRLPAEMQQAKGQSAENSFGLVIGISQYEHFPSLNYADRDAMAFSEFLKSKAGGGLDSSHIFLRTNAQAKAGDIWRGFSWLERRADTAGKTAYIYFSGHGDAASLEEAYLLAHDAPNEGDPNLYNTGGTFQIYNLKSKIKKMVARGVQVILITDACRTNELPGKENGNRWIFQSIMEQRSGELQMTSCASNEQSLEDKRWGGGRGVFSYYLIAGLSGLADNDPEDGEITLYELQRYIKDNVRKETRSLATGKPRQNPLFCCEEKNEQVLAKVDASWKQQMIASMQKSSAMQDIATTRTNTKGIISGVDSNSNKLYSAFKTCLNKNILLGSKASASVYLDSLLALNISSTDKEDLTDELLAALINEGQKTINRYTKPPSKDTGRSIVNKEFFEQGALHFKKATEYCQRNKELLDEMQANQYFLEARALAEETAPTKLRFGIELAKKSITIKPTGYNYQTLGLLYRRSNEFDSAHTYYYKAYQDSPDWINVIVGLKALFKSTGKFYNLDSTLKYLRIIATKNQTPYSYWELGSAYFNSNQKDSGIHYFKKANLASRYDFNYLNQILSAYRMSKDTVSLLAYIRDLQQMDRKYFIQKELAIGRCFHFLATFEVPFNKINIDSSLFWYKKSIEIEPLSSGYKNVVDVFHESQFYDSMYRYARMYYLKDSTSLERAAYLLSTVKDQFSHTQDTMLVKSQIPVLKQIKFQLYNSSAPNYDLRISIADIYDAFNERDSVLLYLKTGVSKTNFLEPLRKIIQYYLEENKPDSALNYIQNLARFARYHSQPLVVYNYISSVFFNMKQYEQCIQYGKEGLKFSIGLHGIGENSKINERGDIIQKIASAYYLSGVKDSSDLYLQQIKKDSSAYNIMMSAFYTNINNQDSSLYYTLQYIKQFENSGQENQYLEGGFYMKRLYHAAFLYFKKADRIKSIEFFKKAVLFRPNESFVLFRMARSENDYSLGDLVMEKEFLELEKMIIK